MFCTPTWPVGAACFHIALLRTYFRFLFSSRGVFLMYKDSLYVILTQKRFDRVETVLNVIAQDTMNQRRRIFAV